MSFDEALEARRAGRRRPSHARLVPAPDGPGDQSTARPSGSPSPRRCGPRWSGGSAPAGCSPTTTCSPGCATRWPTRARRRRPPSGCGSRYRVVLVDEFQDTDPIQWEILRRAFHGHTHPDLDRRPEAGDLRVPRRRRLQLPGRGPAGGSGPHAGHQLAQRRRPGDWARRSDGRRDARRRQIVVRPVARRTRQRPPADRTGRGGSAAPAPIRLRIDRTTPMPTRVDRVAGYDRRSPRTWSPTSPRCWPRACRLELDGNGPRAGAARPTSPCWSAPTSAARRSGTPWSRPASRR